MQKVQKIIKCKVVGLTNIKEAQLRSEFSNIQTLLQLEKEGLDILPQYKNLQLHSANKQQALRFYKRIDTNKDYPISVRKDLIKIEEKNNKLAKYWCRILVRGRRGGLWVAIKPHQNFPEEFEFGESKVFRKKNHKGKWNWWIYITVAREIEMKESYSNILAIDLGSKVTATVCG
ncbi:MAG: hypothetical protein HY514_04725, partial [Candidatus Aenigmarchaeota archaeon]|nr:hypothetical protein [Candidatus Aenigmarchaeota archaeon]